MTTPSQARIDAALRLADLCAKPHSSREYLDEVEAYRATLPRLRTRAEVDAEIARLFRRFMLTDSGELTTLGTSDDALWAHLESLVLESTAPEPAPSAEPIDCEFPEADPCGCEETEPLRHAIEDLKLANESQSAKLQSIADWILDAEGAVKNIKSLAGAP